MTETRAAVAHYPEFVRRVRKHPVAPLLQLLAEAAVALPEQFDAVTWMSTPPAAIAAAAKEAILHERPKQSVRRRRQRLRDPKPTDVLDICRIYNEMYERDVGEDQTLRTLTRTAYEQFGYQESLGEEAARTWALFVDGLSLSQPKFITPATIETILGGSPAESLAVALLLHGSAQVHRGFFDPAIAEQPNFGAEFPGVTLKQVRASLSLFSTDFDGFRRDAAQAGPAATLPLSLARHGYNPLTKTPFVVMPDGRLLAPQPRLILRRVSPTGVYYAGATAWGSDFTDDVGPLVEAYVGRQLETVPGAAVHPEIIYDGGKRSADWFVVLDDLVLIVEAKATRLPIGARAGDETVAASLLRTVGKGIGQVNRSAEHIRSAHPSFSHIPRDRPQVGMVATLEPYYTANGSHARSVLPNPDIPLIVASLREVERLVAVAQREPLADVINRIALDPKLSRWNLSSSLSNLYEVPPNALIQAVWQHIPFPWTFGDIL
jgi:hypothetical protein